LFRRRAMPHGVKPRAPARRGEALSERTRRPGMVVGGAGPEDAALRVDLLVADTGIVGGPALAGAAQLLEDFARTGVAETVSVTEARGDVAQHFDVRPRARWRGLGAAAAHHAALEIRHRSFFLGPLRRWQDAVPPRRRLGEEEGRAGENAGRTQPD